MSTNPVLAMVGLATDEAVKAAKKGHKKLMKAAEGVLKADPEERKRVMEETLAKMPPETLALLCVGAIAHLAHTALALKELGIGLTFSLGDTEAQALRHQLCDTLDVTVERIRSLAKHLAEDVALRQAEGWPEWDFETGSAKGRERPASTMSNDELAALFSGLDFGDL